MKLGWRSRLEALEGLLRAPPGPMTEQERVDHAHKVLQIIRDNFSREDPPIVLSGEERARLIEEQLALEKDAKEGKLSIDDLLHRIFGDRGASEHEKGPNCHPEEG